MFWWHLHQLKSEDIKTLIKAARKLGKSKNPKAVEPLIALLKNNEPDLQRALAEALGNIGDKRAVESLITLFKNNKDKLIKTTVARALINIGDPRGLEVLPKCQKCGTPAVQLMPLQVRAVGSSYAINMDVCYQCLEKATTMAVDTYFTRK
jgi:hypothetical protein